MKLMTVVLLAFSISGAAHAADSPSCKFRGIAAAKEFCQTANAVRPTENCPELDELVVSLSGGAFKCGILNHDVPHAKLKKGNCTAIRETKAPEKGSDLCKNEAGVALDRTNCLLMHDLCEWR